MIHIYYGYGKGKTSILNGSTIRAIGAGLKVGYFRFLKGVVSNEDKVLKNLKIDFFPFHFEKKFVYQMNENEFKQTKIIILNGLDYLKKHYQEYDLIILDEFLDLIDVSIQTEEQLIEIIDLLKEKELMISGHKKYQKLFTKANLITHLEKEKHYYDDQKLLARKGIEY